MRETRKSLTVLFALGAVLALQSRTFAQGGGAVLPAQATPYGWSLTNMTAATAFFDASLNDPVYYPNTPFQVLFVDFGHGVGDTFIVPAGTYFYVPLMWSDDSPPIIGDFPSDASGTAFYVFDHTEIGFTGSEIEVDGKTTPIGPAYAAGPVTTAPLPDGGGTHMVTVGAFLTPMSVGHHSVTIRGQFAGDALIPFGGPWPPFESTYSVTVLPR